ncbi:hypothetical protein H6P81_020890 [Aristolochia fimbriata]|uniref:Protein misato homolog 1 n=1 Tax=Aristolochia fimbriata TaxID=158543 RepID=A0AAV7DXG5_ARIFI|nr:hypothetical protein H6P81_020890 [Aristolochia fimbriata]
MKEIVTIQVGDFSNYIGSHFWNFQDELLGLSEEPHGDPVFRNAFLDMDVLYRTGETQQGIATYTPRLLSIGFQGSLGSLSSCGSFYDETSSSDPSHVITWTGKITRQASKPCKKNLFLKSLEEDEHRPPLLDSTSVREDYSESEIQDKDRVECLQNCVEFWTDFSKVHYHPQSLYELNGLWTDILEFDNYGIGKDVLLSCSQGEEMKERLRFFVEDCDHIQGIHFTVDDSGGFSSVAADFLEHIADEYTNTPVLLYAARGPKSRMDENKRQLVFRALHDSVSLTKLSSFCKLMVPIGLPSLSRSKAATFLSIEDEKPFHCSAVYAAALNSISLPFRMDAFGSSAASNYFSGAIDMGGLVYMLTDQARQNSVAILDVAMPSPPLTGEERKGSVLQSLHSLTPEVAEDIEDAYQVETAVIHGAIHKGGRRAAVSEVKDSFYEAYESFPNKPLFSHLSVTQSPLPIPLPFPSIFGSHVGPRGELLHNPIPDSQPRGSLNIHSIPMAARLRSSNAILPYVEKRLTNLQRFGIDRGAPGSELLRSWGFQNDEVQDMGEVLSKMAMTLKPHSGMSSDSE